MPQKQIQEEIAKKEEKLLDLRKILQGDTAASYKEATQTSEMIEMLELNILDLKKSLEQQNDYLKKIIAIKSNGPEQIFLITKNDGDPSLMRFSIDSPFGDKLLRLSIGDVFIFQEQEYCIKSIDEK